MAGSSDDDLFITPNTFSNISLPDFDISDLIPELEIPSCTMCTIDTEDKSPEGKDKRNIAVVSDVELAKRNEARIPDGTKWSTGWCVRTWTEWAEERRNSNATITSDLYSVVSSDVLSLGNEELNYWLSKFVVEVRKKNPVGQPYPPNTLYQLCCGIQRHLRENGRPELNVFENPSFKLFQNSLDAEMKRLTSAGFGASVKQAESFSDDQEEKLWELNLLGAHSPQVLLDTMVFLVGKNFALRSGKEHRNLQFNQLTLVPGKYNEPEKLVYCSFGEKNNPGGLKHRAYKGKKVEHYSNVEMPERCLVWMYKKYLEKCPKSAFEKKMFYLTPRRNWRVEDKEWFTANPVGHNPLGQTVRKLCQKAGIEGHFTNHSLRATTATRGLEAGVPEKLIMERTGHRDPRSLQRYQRPSIEMKQAISKCLESRGRPFAEQLNKRKSSAVISEEETKKLCFETDSNQSSSNMYFENCTFHFN